MRNGPVLQAGNIVMKIRALPPWGFQTGKGDMQVNQLCGPVCLGSRTMMVKNEGGKAEAGI